MSHHIVAFRSIIWSARFCNAGWRHSGWQAFHFRHHRALNYGVVALLAIAPYLLIAAVTLFFA